MSESAEGFSGLPAVADELDAIVMEEGGNDSRGVLPGKVLLNEDFTAVNLAQMLGKGYPVIHIASHFAFRPGTAEDSFILMGDGSRLTLSELDSSRYPFKFIDLLTLSACDTAVGGEDTHGREIESFAAFAQNRGAQAVLGALWAVADASTGTFMALFYRLRAEYGLSQAKALGQAQRMFLAGDDNTDAVVEDQRGVEVVEEESGGFMPPPGAPYAHPFYWAPFILMGNAL